MQIQIFKDLKKLTVGNPFKHSIPHGNFFVERHFMPFKPESKKKSWLYFTVTDREGKIGRIT